jgi:hypothetical protein
MSKHSKHGRGKHSHFRRSQKHQTQMNAGVTQPGEGFVQSNTGTMQPTTGAMQPSGGFRQPVTRATPMTSRPAVSSAAPQTPGQRRQAASSALPLHYEFISGDLRYIGILTVIILAILVVLSIFLK